jgi:hypothetical protein
MRINRTDSALCVLMFASLVGAHLMNADNILSDLRFLPMLAPLLFFVFPLCLAFRNGIASAQDQLSGTAAGSSWTAFGNVMWHRVYLWLVLWIMYFVILDVCLEDVICGYKLTLSVSSMGLILGMVAGCFAWAPRCNRLWTLALLTELTAVPAFVLLFFLGAFVLDVLGLGGYMGLGIAIYVPFIAFGCLLAAAVLAWIWAWRHGDAWFRT